MHLPTDKCRPGPPLITADEIASIVARLGREISSDYRGKNPILVNLLKGGVVFLADLIRQINVPHEIDFMAVSSYERGTQPSGAVRIVEDLNTNVRGRHVVIVEDVLDTGQTLAYILDMLRIRSPKSIEICSLLKKKSASRRKLPQKIRYLGTKIPDVFVVGYGLDYNEHFRHLPYIAELVEAPEL